MKTSLIAMPLVAVLLLLPLTAEAHCDAVDGPVATAARKALETKNVNLILPYAAAQFEPELTTVFHQVLGVRDLSPEVSAVAERYFMETAVRLHRAGENAPYVGLKPAGTDFGPAIPAAEKAVASESADALIKVLSEQLSSQIANRLKDAVSKKAATKEPTSHSDVQGARDRINAELALINYVEGVYLAITSGGHFE